MKRPHIAWAVLAPSLVCLAMPAAGQGSAPGSLDPRPWPWEKRPVKDPMQPTAGALSTSPYLDGQRHALGPGSMAPATALPLCQWNTATVPAAGGEFDLSNWCLKGDRRATLVIFWAFWCDTWKDATRELDGMEPALHAQGIRVAAIAVDAAQQPVARPAFARGDIRWPVAIDINGAAGAAWGVRRVPTAFLVDNAGVIRAVWEGLPGAVDWPREMKAALVEKKMSAPR